MNRTGRRRLRLAVETVRILGIRELQGVVGGSPGSDPECVSTTMVHPTESVKLCQRPTEEVCKV